MKRDKFLPVENLHWITPHILIGNHDMAKFRLRFDRTLPSGFTCYKSAFGKIITGQGFTNRIPEAPNVPNLILPIFSIHCDEEDDEIDEDSQLNQIVGRLFEPSQVGLETAKEDDINVQERFEETVELINDRYQVSMPWKSEDLPFLESNFSLAFKRYFSNLTSLRKRGLLQRYNQQILDLLAEDIIELVHDPKHFDNVVHYLPHQAVFREDKDKLRIVYDGSAKPRKKHSQSTNASSAALCFCPNWSACCLDRAIGDI